jgi:hypothetical protein
LALLRLCVNPGQLGRESLHTNVGKTHRRHRAAQIHRATGGNGQRLESFFILPSAFALSNARSLAASF